MNQATHTTIRPVDTRVTETKSSFLRVYAMDLTRSRRESPDVHSSAGSPTRDSIPCSWRCRATSAPADVVALPPIVEAAARSGLRVQMDLTLHVASDGSPCAKCHPDWYRPPSRPTADPRQASRPLGTHFLNLPAQTDTEAFIEEMLGRDAASPR